MPEAYSVRNEFDTSNNVAYYARAVPGAPTSSAVWQIQKLTYSPAGDVQTALWADGNTAFDNVFDSRASLSYS